MKVSNVVSSNCRDYYCERRRSADACRSSIDCLILPPCAASLSRFSRRSASAATSHTRIWLLVFIPILMCWIHLLQNMSCALSAGIMFEQFRLRSTYLVCYPSHIPSACWRRSQIPPAFVVYSRGTSFAAPGCTFGTIPPQLVLANM